MNIDALSKGIGLVSTTITILKNLNDIFPPGNKKYEAEKTLEEAEKTLRIAEAEIAKGFNYQLCRRHFPPGILLDIAPFKSKCKTCGHVEDYEV